MSDDAIIPLLRKLRRPTFFTRDSDFFDKTLCNDRHCLVSLDVKPLLAAEYIRRFLRHPNFKTWAQRQGCVMRIAVSGISAWRIRARKVARYRWAD